MNKEYSRRAQCFLRSPLLKPDLGATLVFTLSTFYFVDSLLFLFYAVSSPSSPANQERFGGAHAPSECHRHRPQPAPGCCTPFPSFLYRVLKRFVSILIISSVDSTIAAQAPLWNSDGGHRHSGSDAQCTEHRLHRQLLVQRCRVRGHAKIQRQLRHYILFLPAVIAPWARGYTVSAHPPTRNSMHQQ